MKADHLLGWRMESGKNFRSVLRFLRSSLCRLGVELGLSRERSIDPAGRRSYGQGFWNRASSRPCSQSEISAPIYFGYG